MLTNECSQVGKTVVFNEGIVMDMNAEVDRLMKMFVAVDVNKDKKDNDRKFKQEPVGQPSTKDKNHDK